MRDSIRLFSLLFLALFVMSCGSGNPSPKAGDTTQGRPGTKIVEGASAVGHNGSQMRKKIDRVLDRNEERTGEIEKVAAAAASK